MGKAHWLGALLPRLPTYMTVAIVDADRPASMARLAWAMRNDNCLLLFAEDRPSGLAHAILHHVLTFSRKLLWASTNSTRPSDEDLAQAESGLLQTCSLEAVIALTSKDGSTTFSKAESLCRYREQAVERWLPAAGWQSNAPLFAPRCSSWTRSSPPGTITLHYNRPYSKSQNLLDHPINQVMITLADRMGERFVSIYSGDGNFSGPMDLALNCRLDVMALARPLHHVVHVPPHLVAFPWEMMRVVMVVPSDMGRSRGLFHTLTGELQPPVWAAVVAAAVVVLVGLTLLSRGRPRGRRAADVLNVLAPLLGSPSRGVLAPQRPLSGSWMLVCIVLVAAYQGTLLSRLSNGAPVEQLMSYADLMETNLSVLAPDAMFDDALPPELYPRLIYTSALSNEMQLSEMAQRRDAAKLLSVDFINSLVPFMVPVKLLHAFTVPTRFARSIFLTAKNSPYEEPLRQILGRAHASGLLCHWNSMGDFNISRTKQREKLVDRHKPLGWRNVRALFTVWAAGLAAALAAFAVESIPALAGD
ncbi:uncharacterized protein LOC117643960 [Thrips palmi]|uniref:Uncharacterized protein LOC117643960 n=1 Tax=Thrips palmi TaxID=161013 RepID=A0A6P8YH09_THRPL|nr:uncharacterized protein LOC117643960 [Thrips palmi]